MRALFAIYGRYVSILTSYSDNMGCFTSKENTVDDERMRMILQGKLTPELTPKEQGDADLLFNQAMDEVALEKWLQLQAIRKQAMDKVALEQWLQRHGKRV